MKLSSNKRFLALALVLMLVLSLVPMQVLAVQYLDTTVLDGKIRISTDGISGQGSAIHNEDGTITVTSVATANCSGGAYTFVANDHTITITNTTAEMLVVEFDYAATGLGTLTIEGADKTAFPSGHYSLSLAAGSSATIVVTSPATGVANGDKATGDAASIVLSNFTLKDTGAKTVTVVRAEGGSVTVNGSALTADSVALESDFETGVALTATAAQGYVFLGWVDSDLQVLSTLPEFTLRPLADTTVTAAFVADDDQPYWLGGGTLHTDLKAACAAAVGEKQVVLLKSGILPAGTHTVPAGVSVLIPFDDAKTAFGAEPELMPNQDAFDLPNPYCTLTMAAGAVLVVDGSLELAARHHVSSGSGSVNYGGAIDDKFGHIDMEAGSEIQVNGTLYAWGIVSGEGEVVANSGSTVHEKMQIHDYRGGSITSSMATTYAERKLFPFSQYYVQNVEVKETIHAGATLMVNVGVYLSTPEQTSVAFVGGQGAMFTMCEGAWVTKQYNAAEDRLVIDVYGNTTLGSITLSFEGNEVNSSSFRLGINNNIDINIHSGVATINQEMILQPGATVTVDRDATVFNTTSLYAMDAEDWGTYAKGKTLMPIKWSYPNGTTVKRSSVTDAVLNINGTVINAGYVFSSGSDSIISSEKTGVYALLNPAISGSSIYQVTSNDPSRITVGEDWVQIPFTAAVLVNGDKTALTAEGGQYDAYIYDTVTDSWVCKNIYNDGAGYTATVTYDGNGGNGSVAPATVDYFGTAAGFIGSNYTAIAPFSFAAASNGFSRAGYSFLGWSTDDSAAVAQVVPGQFITVAQDTTLYALWDADSFVLTVDGVGHDVDCGSDLSAYVTEPSRDGFRFTGWTVTGADGTAVEAPAVMPAHDLTFTSNWVKESTLTFVDENGDVLASGVFTEGAAITAPDYAPEGFRFLGWVNTSTGAVETVPAVMPAFDLEYQASIEAITYTVTFINGTAEIGEVTVGYGEEATLLDAPADGGDVFKGWGASAEQADYAAGEAVALTGDLTLYAVWHNHSFENGTCTGCGETDPDYVKPSTAPTVGLKYPSLSFEDVIIMNVYYTATDLQDVVEMGLITYTEKPEAGSVETADKVIPGYTWSESDGFYFSSTAGIAPKDLGDTIYFAVYWKLADGTYGYTRVIGYSPKTYALNQLKTGKVEMRPLVAAMLNYGAAAQNYFNYKTNALVNATMTDEQKALVADYSADMIAAVTQASGAKLGEFINDKTYTKRYPTISFEGAFCINYYFQPTLAVEGDVTMYIWSLEDYEAAEVLTKENATKAVKMELTESGEYLGVVDGIAAKDLDKAAYVTFCYNDGTADHCGGVLAYTIGMYCKSQASKTGTLADLAKACAVYGYYAKQLFNK